MGLLLWIVVGAAAGSLARWVMPGPSAGGLPVAIGIGILGAVAGGGIGFLLGPPVAGFDLRAMLLAIAASLAVLLCYRGYALRFEA